MVLKLLVCQIQQIGGSFFEVNALLSLPGYVRRLLSTGGQAWWFGTLHTLKAKDERVLNFNCLSEGNCLA